MILNDWQRIEKIVRWTGLSVNSFALNVGLNRGENLYQIKKGNHGISKELAEAISAKYPEISRAWIITGEGEMFVSESGERSAIPCYETDVLYLACLDKLPQPSYLVSLPRLRGVSFAGLLLSRAMEPDIPAGAMVMLQEIAPDKIVPGLPYLIVSARPPVLRTVKKEPGSTQLQLVSPNPDFNEMIIDLCEIRKLYIVKAHVFYNS